MCRQAAFLANVPLEILYQNIVWQLEDCYTIFIQISQTGLNDTIDAFAELNVEDSTKTWLINVLRCWRQMPLNPIDI